MFISMLPVSEFPRVRTRVASWEGQHDSPPCLSCQADALVDRRLYKLLMTFFGLDRHLDNLKNLFLMGYGALFHSFLVKARDAMRSPAGDR